MKHMNRLKDIEFKKKKQSEIRIYNHRNRRMTVQ